MAPKNHGELVTWLSPENFGTADNVASVSTLSVGNAFPPRAPHSGGRAWALDQNRHHLSKSLAAKRSLWPEWSGRGPGLQSGARSREARSCRADPSPPLPRPRPLPRRLPPLGPGAGMPPTTAGGAVPGGRSRVETGGRRALLQIAPSAQPPASPPSPSSAPPLPSGSLLPTYAPARFPPSSRFPFSRSPSSLRVPSFLPPGSSQPLLPQPSPPGSSFPPPHTPPPRPWTPPSLHPALPAPGAPTRLLWRRLRPPGGSCPGPGGQRRPYPRPPRLAPWGQEQSAPSPPPARECLWDRPAPGSNPVRRTPGVGVAAARNRVPSRPPRSPRFSPSPPPSRRCHWGRGTARWSHLAGLSLFVGGSSKVQVHLHRKTGFVSPVRCSAPQLTALIASGPTASVSVALCAAVRVWAAMVGTGGSESGLEKRGVRTGNGPPGLGMPPYRTQSARRAAHRRTQSAEQLGSEGDFEILTVHTLIFGLLVKIGKLNIKRGNKEGWWDLKIIDERSD